MVQAKKTFVLPNVWRVGGKKGLSFLSSQSQVVILSDYFRVFFSEVVAGDLPFLHSTVNREAGATTEVEGPETSM